MNNLRKDFCMRLLFLTPLLITITVYSADTSESLLVRFQVARDSVVNQQGFAPGDLEVIKSLRNDLSTWNNSNNDANTLAAELQLTLWLNDNERADELFRLLIATQPENPAIGLAWSRFAMNLPNADSEVIFTELLRLYPTSSEVVLDWATQLDKQNRFSEALGVLSGLDSDELTTPETAGLLSDLLFAENRFEEALAALERVDKKTLADNPAQKASIDSRITRYNEILTKWEHELAIRETEATIDDLPRVQLITSKGPILLELFEDHAPNTVANFISLAQSGYYDGTRFHRVLPKFMAQGGDPNSRTDASGQAGGGGPGYNIKDEHTLDDIRHHFAGSLSMAKTAAENSGGSQFFLTHLPTSHLDGRHTVFGRIVDGLNIARSIEKDDDIMTMTIIRKRDHEYTPEKLGPDGKPLVVDSFEDTIKSNETTPVTTRKPTLNP
ncbi:MAG: peptidylprolyl isomerase [Phycisphaerales bacterium]|nr:peptidylprolyl isomerase [Phycisphaerales bacterium]